MFLAAHHLTSTRSLLLTSANSPSHDSRPLTTLSRLSLVCVSLPFFPGRARVVLVPAGQVEVWAWRRSYELDVLRVRVAHLARMETSQLNLLSSAL